VARESARRQTLERPRLTYHAEMSKAPRAYTKKPTPSSRPFRSLNASELRAQWLIALKKLDGLRGAHCIHELWMRGEFGATIEPMLEQLWKSCAASLPDWLPMRHVGWLPKAYEVALRFGATKKGRSNIYLVLLDYADRRSGPFGIYVGMSGYPAAVRFDQHKAGIRAAGSVLKRGIEPLIGPVMHLQNISRNDAERIEVDLAVALEEAGVIVKGGH
jgi:hypothetical protein